VGGASIDLQPGSNLLRYLEREEVFDPNVAFMTPSFCETLLRGRRSDRAYRFMVSAGDRLAESTFTRCEARHGPLINLYGSTEMGVIACGDLTMPSALRSGTVGRLLAGVDFRVQPTEGTDIEHGVGELQLKHAWGFDGYVDLDGRPLKPPGAFDGDWYCTRDLAMAGDEGTLQILGRCDLSINRHGRLLPFSEVEQGLREVEGIEEAAVLAGPEEGLRGRAMIAYCVLTKGVQVEEKVLLKRYAQRAPSFARPDALYLIERLPRLPNSKLDRQTLGRLAAASLAEAAIPASTRGE
jgi:acyl-coenzyme A synthetase/AMP-(fatty) acid ligase